MAWRGLHLSQASRLSLSDGQIVIAQDDGTVRLPLEDIAWLILDTQQATLTAALLSACMEAGVAVIATDATHLPNGAMLTFHGHHRQADMARRQVEMNEPLKKRLWQAIVRRKIANQAAVLATRKAEGSKALAAMVAHVGSGDPKNTEARAARHYWRTLFEQFRREDESDHRNKLLNYGYAVVRSAIGRALVANGLLPAFGIHHASVTNAFNLADDLLEPFRPFVDNLAFILVRDDKEADLTLADRRSMAGALLVDATMGDETTTLLAATELTSASLVRAIVANDPGELILPSLAT
jgi:CRISPR-associated protein Cas1